MSSLSIGCMCVALVVEISLSPCVSSLRPPLSRKQDNNGKTPGINFITLFLVFQQQDDTTMHSSPRFRWDYPPNLSISVSGGKEIKRDSPSRGDRKGKSPAHNLPGHPACGGLLRMGETVVKPHDSRCTKCVPKGRRWANVHA